MVLKKKNKSISVEEYKELEQGFIEERKKMEDRMWLDSNLNKFDEVIRLNYDSSIKRFSEAIIQHLAKLVNAVHGAFFVVDFDKSIVKATAGYATTVETMDRTEFKMGEGIIGQVAKSKEMLCLDDLETHLDSSLGRVNASYLVVCQLVFNHTTYAVLELTTLSKLKPRYIILIERACRNAATVLQSIINNQKTKVLLTDSLQQSEKFRLQEQELHNREKELALLKNTLQQKEEELQAIIDQMNSEELSSLNIKLQSQEEAAAELDQAKKEINFLKAEL